MTRRRFAMRDAIDLSPSPSPSPPRERRVIRMRRGTCQSTRECPAASAAGSVALALALAALLLAGCDGEPAAPPPNPDRPQRLPTARITVGDVSLEVEVADSEAERRKGMMFRERLAENEAMLFVFEQEMNAQFWMKNTPANLDIAYIAADGTITQIGRLTAHDLDAVYSREPVRFALEVPAGWFTGHNVNVGAKVLIPPDVAGPAQP